MGRGFVFGGVAGCKCRPACDQMGSPTFPVLVKYETAKSKACFTAGGACSETGRSLSLDKTSSCGLIFSVLGKIRVVAADGDAGVLRRLALKSMGSSWYCRDVMTGDEGIPFQSPRC